jgi:hypothetical protein
MRSKTKTAAVNLTDRIHARFADLDGLDLVIPIRAPVYLPSSFDGGSNAPRIASRAVHKP